MSVPRSILCALLLALAACSGATQLKLPPPPPALPKAEAAADPQVPLETALVVAGTPTGVYALIARGALNCWFGADGPLKPSHVFEAEAEPPASGGAAEIVLYERDEALRDKRGPRALRVKLAGTDGNVRVGTSVIRLERQLAEAMVKDVETWARGGSGCQVRAQLPAPAQGPAVKEKAGAAPAKRR